MNKKIFLEKFKNNVFKDFSRILSKFIMISFATGKNLSEFIMIFLRYLDLDPCFLKWIWIRLNEVDPQQCQKHPIFGKKSKEFINASKIQQFNKS